jgi:hypothetical protein
MSSHVPISGSDFFRAMPPRMDAVRKLLVGLIEDRGLNLSQVSLKLGKSHSYLQQFIKRGVPAKLPEDVRAQLAELFGVDETLLGKQPSPASRLAKMSDAAKPAESIPEFDVRAGTSYGGGIDTQEWEEAGNASQMPVAQWGLPAAFIRNELGLTFGQADIIPVRGDSMDDGTKHGLSSGDRVIVDRLDTDPRQGGIFAVWDGGGVIVKQVELIRGEDPPRIICKSRNPAYAPIELTIDGNVHVIGRISAKIARM